LQGETLLFNIKNNIILKFCAWIWLAKCKIHNQIFFIASSFKTYRKKRKN